MHPSPFHSFLHHCALKGFRRLLLLAVSRDKVGWQDPMALLGGVLVAEFHRKLALFRVTST